MQEITLWDTGRKNDETTLADNSSVPVEYETADGVMSSFLLASDRDECDGGVNLLAKSDAEQSIMRVPSRNIAAELMELAFGTKDS